MSSRFKYLSDWLSWMESLHPSEIDLGLERVKTVAARLAIHKPSAKVITVAGTNGKGSFVKALSSLLINTGARVGTYTSPHIQSYNERIQIDGINASDELICQAFTALDQARGTDTLTYFEFATLAALYIFELKEVDYVVLEVGLGGRLDAVNIVDANISVITSIGIDHENWLGSDRESIGFEKAGILRLNQPFVCVDNDPPKSVLDTANTLCCSSYYLGRQLDIACDGEAATLTFTSSEGEKHVLLLPHSNLPLPSLLAAAQVFALLLPTSNVLDLASQLSSLRLNGRFQSKFIDGHDCLLDVAHNPQAAVHLAKKLEQRALRGLVVIFAAMRDKDIAGIVAALRPYVATWICTQVENTPRSFSAEELLARVTAAGGKAMSASTPKTAMSKAQDLHLDSKLPILIMGSFYLVSEFSIDSVAVNEKSYE